MTTGTTLSAAALVLTAVLAVWIARVSALERATFNAFCNEYQVSTEVQAQVVALGKQMNATELVTAQIMTLLTDRLVACEDTIDAHHRALLIAAQRIGEDQPTRSTKTKPVIWH
jgi:hypothetical protein